MIWQSALQRSKKLKGHLEKVLTNRFLVDNI